MEKVREKMAKSAYHTVEEMVSDFIRMFENACKYNETDSLIYKVHPLAIVLIKLIFTLLLINGKYGLFIKGR